MGNSHYNLSNISIPRIPTSLYDQFIDNVTHLINLFDSGYKLTPDTHLQLDLSEHLKVLKNRLNFNVNTQLLLTQLSRRDFNIINSLINRYHYNNDIFNAGLYEYLSSNPLNRWLNIDDLKDYYILGDYDYLDTILPENCKDKYIFSKLLFELDYCHTNINIILDHNMSHNYNQTLITLGNLFQYNYEQIINKFDLILSDYNKLDHIKISTLRTSEFFHKNRDLSYIAYLINNTGAFASKL